jgi:hypothetical protein
LNAEQINSLSPENKERYVRLEKLFGSEGWKDIEAYAKVNAMVALDRQMNAGSWDQFTLAKGARLAYQSVAELQATTELEFEQLAADAQAAAENDDSIENE